MGKKVSITRISDAGGKPVHPLLAVRSRHTPGEMAKVLGHKNHTTVSIYCARAKRSKNLLVPAEWARPLADLFGVQPAKFRPDLFKDSWT